MKFALVALIASASALKIRDDKPAVARTYNEFSERVPNLPGFNNDEVLATEMVQIGDVKNNYYKGGWKETHIPAPATNHCVNVNKALGKEQSCSTPGNSAWNTLTTSRTGKPTQAQAAPYPDHKLH